MFHIENLYKLTDHKSSSQRIKILGGNENAEQHCKEEYSTVIFLKNSHWFRARVMKVMYSTKSLYILQGERAKHTVHRKKDILCIA